MWVCKDFGTIVTHSTMDKEMYAKNWTHPWNVRGAINCATTNGQFVKGYVILYKWYHNEGIFRACIIPFLIIEMSLDE